MGQLCTVTLLPSLVAPTMSQSASAAPEGSSREVDVRRTCAGLPEDTNPPLSTKRWGTETANDAAMVDKSGVLSINENKDLPIYLSSSLK